MKRLAGMEFTAVGMNFVDKRGNDLRISILVDSVAKVKDMSSVSDMTEIFNNLTGLLSHDIFAGKQLQKDPSCLGAQLYPESMHEPLRD